LLVSIPEMSHFPAAVAVNGIAAAQIMNQANVRLIIW
jgi:hypothetical protein